MCYTSLKEKEIVWKLFTINDKKELDELVKKEKKLKNYCNKLSRLSKDKEYCQMIWDERIEENLRKVEDYLNGKNDGERIGIEQTKTEMIINFYENGASLELISKASNLSIDEIKKIIKNKE